VNDLLGDDAKRQSLGERAAAYGVAQLWPSVARAYLESFERACADHKQQDVRDTERRRSSRAVHFVGSDELAESSLPLLDVGDQLIAAGEDTVQVVVGLFVGEKFAERAAARFDAATISCASSVSAVRLPRSSALRSTTSLMAFSSAPGIS